jgi:prepilin-type N-terminal cleavage/methylation domain-containing protein
MVKRLGSKGVTLTEVLLVTAILGVISLVIPKLMQQTNQFFLMNRSRMEVQQEARMIISNVAKNLRQANASSIVISQDAGQPPYSGITFVKRNKTLGSNNANGDTVQYVLRSGGRFFMSINGKEALLSSNVAFVAFGFPRTDDRQVVTFSISVGKSVGAGKTKLLHVTSEKIGVMNQ